MIAADYASAIAYLDSSRLPAYVSFLEQASTRGITDVHEVPRRIYIRMSDGAIVDGVPPAAVHVVKSHNGNSDNPFRKHAFFEPQCYAAKSEIATRWNGQAAVRFDLKPKCDDDNGIAELYVDPQSLRPIAVDGNIVDASNPTMTVAMELRYSTVDQYTVPSSILAHAVGHGMLFWVRERVEIDYSDYQFHGATEVPRRQASKP